MNLYFKTAFAAIRRSPFQATAAVFVLSITFFVISLLSILIYSSDKLLSYFESRPQVIAFLKNEATPNEVSNLQSKLTADSRIKDVKYVSNEEALGIYKEATTDNPLLAELVSPSIFPASLEFSLADLNFAQKVIEEVKNEKIVDQVGFTANLGGEKTLENTVERLRLLTTYLRIGGAAFVGILLATSFLVLVVIVSMRLTARRGEIEILNLIGATGAFIRNPIVIEAITYVLVGVLIGWLLTFIGVLYSAPAVVSYFNQIPVLPRRTLDLLGLFGIIFAIEVIIGALLATVGSSLAVTRSLKKK